MDTRPLLPGASVQPAGTDFAVESVTIRATSTSPVTTPAGRPTTTCLLPGEDAVVVAPTRGGAAVTVTVCVAGLLVPAALSTVRRTVYVPAAVNVCAGCCSVAVVPSPKSQAQEVGVPVD